MTKEVILGGDVRVRGVEFGIVGGIALQWQVRAGYTFSDGKVLK